MDTARSVNGVPIRLTHERWYHIVENDDEMSGNFHDVLETIESPEFVVRGSSGSLKATRSRGKRKSLVVVHRELSKGDGFVITAYFLSDKPKGKIEWPRH
jgi:hypothetical protein